eukprot:1176727-Prorocentrum_minimum.AAC.2
MIHKAGAGAHFEKEDHPAAQLALRVPRPLPLAEHHAGVVPLANHHQLAEAPRQIGGAARAVRHQLHVAEAVAWEAPGVGQVPARCQQLVARIKQAPVIEPLEKVRPICQSTRCSSPTTVHTDAFQTRQGRKIGQACDSIAPQGRECVCASLHYCIHLREWFSQSCQRGAGEYRSRPPLGVGSLQWTPPKGSPLPARARAPSPSAGCRRRPRAGPGVTPTPLNF